MGHCRSGKVPVHRLFLLPRRPRWLLTFISIDWDQLFTFSDDFFFRSDFGGVRPDWFVFAVCVSQMAGRCTEGQRRSTAGVPGRHQTRSARNSPFWPFNSIDLTPFPVDCVEMEHLWQHIRIRRRISCQKMLILNVLS